MVHNVNHQLNLLLKLQVKANNFKTFESYAYVPQMYKTSSLKMENTLLRVMKTKVVEFSCHEIFRYYCC